LVDEDLDEATRRGFIETMQGQVQRLAKLSTDLLDLSRVDAGQLSVVREPVDLGSVVHMLASEIEPLAGGSGHEVRTEIDDDVWCLGDDARILQIGRALVTNAITHTPEGTTVMLRARRRGTRSELVVEDDGPGIPAGQRDAVFGRFYRVEGGMASGSGLGLAIARELARLMGGDVTLQSVARPTAFVVDFPGEAVPDGAVFSRENAAQRRERVRGS
jgi:signal transduction histidine kinase